MNKEKHEPEAHDRAAQTIPRWLAHAPVSSLAPMGKVPGFLLDAGFTSIGEVAAKTDEELMSIRGVGKASVDRLRRRLCLLLRLEELRPHRRAADPAAPDSRWEPPRVSSAVLEALLEAKTVRGEIEALAEGLPPRNASLFLARLGVQQGSRPNLEDLGVQWGISRERVRQVVEQRNGMLAQSGLGLPLTTRLAELLDGEGGFASTPELLELARAQGIDADEPALHSVRHVHELGLAPLIEHVQDVDSWVTAGGKRRWLRSGILAEHVERVRRIGYAFFRRISSIQECRLADGCLLNRWQRTRALVSRYGRMEEVEGYLVPEPTTSSKLTRSVQKMLAVAPELSVRDVSEGLTRLQREFRVIPPVSVIEYILSHHPAFDVQDGIVRATDTLPVADPLSKAERAFVSLLDGEGGVVPYRILMEGMEAEGFSRHTAAVLMARSPFLRRPDTGLYATMGRPLPRKRLLEQHVNGRQRNGKS